MLEINVSITEEKLRKMIEDLEGNTDPDAISLRAKLIELLKSSLN